MVVVIATNDRKVREVKSVNNGDEDLSAVIIDGLSLIDRGTIAGIAVLQMTAGA